MSAETIAKALGGRRTAAGWIAPCPAHDDRDPSLSIADSEKGNVLVHCHAGCEQHQVIAALRVRGLWSGTGRRRANATDSLAAAINPRVQGEQSRTQAALRLWSASVPVPGTLVETYLHSRGLHLTPPPTIRFHKGLRHPSGGMWPAMVALVTLGCDGTPMAVHRTFLARDGGGKAPVEPVKMMLGPCRGGVIRLGPIGDRLLIAEGIETALSAMQATGQPAWAALSTSGVRALELPADVADVVVLADGDEPGEVAALGAGLRWKHEGRRVRIARPPRGFDFNDVLRGRAISHVEGTP